MERHQEIRQPIRPMREPDRPPPPPEERCDGEELSPPLAVSPPPMPWPRVFPSL